MKKKMKTEETQKKPQRQIPNAADRQTVHPCAVCLEDVDEAEIHAHLRTLHADLVWKTGFGACPDCGVRVLIPEFSAHMLEAHDRVDYRNARDKCLPDKPAYPCPVCRTTRTRSDEALDHLATHGDHFPFACAECDVRMQTRRGHRDHLRMHKQREERRENARRLRQAVKDDAASTDDVSNIAEAPNLTGEDGRKDEELDAEHEEQFEHREVKQRDVNKDCIKIEPDSATSLLRECLVCAAEVPPADLEDHILDQHESNLEHRSVWRCGECGVDLADEDEAEKHAHKEHESERSKLAREFPCVACGKRTEGMVELARHMAMCQFQD